MRLVTRLESYIQNLLLTPAISQTEIYENDKSTKGVAYCPIILGADKTTVSVATGHVEYHPLYLSLGNIHNMVRRGHRSGVAPIAFLAIPKSMFGCPANLFNCS